jgi:hypothetical protein
MARMTNEFLKMQAMMFDLRASILGCNSDYIVSRLPLTTKNELDTFESLLEHKENASGFVS